MNFQPFELEEYLSRWERSVAVNLGDSGVKCLKLGEWLDDDQRARVLEADLFYPEVNGTAQLRERIAALYPGVDPEQVLVTVGAAQANSLVAETLLEPGDEVVVITPGYRQIWGLARNRSCLVREAPLDETRGWRLDIEALERAVNERTRLVSIVNPNNPAGVVFSDDERRRIVAACARHGAWLHADEVYQGTEHAGPETPSFWTENYPRTICVNSLSKAYGLAGLRIGWAVAPREMIDELWRRHEYMAIAAGAPSMMLAEWALETGKRQTLLRRQRDMSRAGREVFDRWVAERSDRFSLQPAHATSLAFLRYKAPLSSFAMAEHIRLKGDMLVVPGEALGRDRHLRIAVGYDLAKLHDALQRLDEATLDLA